MAVKLPTPPFNVYQFPEEKSGFLVVVLVL